jgi:hypothetical protein
VAAYYAISRNSKPDKKFSKSGINLKKIPKQSSLKICQCSMLADSPMIKLLTFAELSFHGAFIGSAYGNYEPQCYGVCLWG